MLIHNLVEKELGIDNLSSDMQIKIAQWNDMYKGNAPWCKDYVESMGIEKGVCRELANVALLEMESSVSYEPLDELYQKALDILNEKLQRGLAIGSMIIKPTDKGVQFLTPDKFIPIEFDGEGRLIDVIFVDSKKKAKNEFYYRLERHTINKQTKKLVISNTAYLSNDGTKLGKPVPLFTVLEWGNYQPYLEFEGVERADFGYYRNPIDNDIDDSNNGVSVFDLSISEIKKADRQHARLEWEFESGERVIHVEQNALLPNTAENKRNRLPSLNKRLYKSLRVQGKDGSDFFNEFSPQFRDENIINGLNSFLRRIEFNCCLAYGDLSEQQEVEKTATEIRASKKRKYDFVTAIQKNLKVCLEDLVYSLAFYNAMLTTGYEFFCTFNDSIMTDEETERAEDRKDLANETMLPYEYRMKWRNEDEETAKAKLAEIGGVDF